MKLTTVNRAGRDPHQKLSASSREARKAFPPQPRPAVSRRQVVQEIFLVIIVDIVVTLLGPGRVVVALGTLE